MDFPKSVPNVGLVNGRFVDEDVLTGKVGSLIPAVWGNTITGEVLNVLYAAGINPDESKDNQLAQAFNKKANKSTTLAGYGIEDAYNQSEINQFLAGKAAKANSLAGYGIQDAYNQSEINQFLGGKAGKATSLAGYGIQDAYTQSEINQFLGGKAGKATSLAGYGIQDAYTQSEINQFLSGKAATATSLAGYGISIATQLEAEAGTDNVKAMTALRAAQLIAKKVVAAGETIAGIARFSTVAELIAGASGYLAVCPQYLLSGFSYNFGSSGYIKLPTWLAGFMVQWATTGESINSSDYRFFPTPFPTQVFGAWLQLNSNVGFGTNSGTVLQVVDQNRYLWNAGGTFGSEGSAFLIALGR